MSSVTTTISRLQELTDKINNTSIELEKTFYGGVVKNGEPSHNVTIRKRKDGELELGRFRWECIGEADPTCGTGNFPLAIAVTGQFRLEFSPSSDLPSGLGLINLSPVGDRLGPPDNAPVTTDIFEAKSSGIVTVVATTETQAVDFTDLDLREVDRLTVSRALPPPTPNEWGCTPGDPPPGEGASADTFVGEGARVQAMPYSGDTRLAGNLVYEWESLSPELLSVDPLGGREARLDGLSEGVAQLAVRAGGHEEIVEIVIEAEFVGSTGDESGAESGSGSGSGSGMGTGTGAGTDTEGDTEGGTTGGGR